MGLVDILVMVLSKTALKTKVAPCLPICLAEEVTLVRHVSKDEKILMSDIQYDPHRLDFQLCAMAARCSMSKRS